jgi:short subunit fatty acids transporter
MHQEFIIIDYIKLLQYFPVILKFRITDFSSSSLSKNIKFVMAIAYGEAWMNMAQPFWALPALAIAGLGARDIMGYCIIVLLYSSVIFIAGIMLF